MSLTYTEKEVQSILDATQDAINKGGLQNGVFIAAYGTTTNTEIYEAYQAGKAVFATDGTFVYSLFLCTSDMTMFTAVDFSTLSSIRLAYVMCFYDQWTQDSRTVELTANKVTAISVNSTDTQYPSAKAVYDAIQAAKATLADARDDKIYNMMWGVNADGYPTLTLTEKEKVTE